MAELMVRTSPDEVVTVLGDIDRRVLSGALAKFIVRETDHSLSSGVWEWFDDDRAILGALEIACGDLRAADPQRPLLERAVGSRSPGSGRATLPSANCDVRSRPRAPVMLNTTSPPRSTCSPRSAPPSRSCWPSEPRSSKGLKSTGRPRSTLELDRAGAEA
jgi:hypothetical protein